MIQRKLLEAGRTRLGGFMAARIAESGRPFKCGNPTLQTGFTLQGYRHDLEKIPAAFALVVADRLRFNLHAPDSAPAAAQPEQSVSRRSHLQFQPAIVAL